MNIIKEIDPDMLHKIDKKNNIIICTPPVDKCIQEFETPDLLSITLTQDMNLSLGSNISANVISMEYKPRIKIQMPTGLRMNIVEPENGDLVNIFDKVYCNYNTFFGYDQDNKELIYKTFENLVFTLYIDVIQMRKKMAPLILSKGSPIADIYFTWYIQTKYAVPSIENIYLIKDLYIYQEFNKVI